MVEPNSDQCLLMYIPLHHVCLLEYPSNNQRLVSKGKTLVAVASKLQSVMVQRIYNLHFWNKHQFYKDG